MSINRGVDKEDVGGVCPGLGTEHLPGALCSRTGSPALKESACNAGDPNSIPGSGRSPGEGKGYPLQYSGLETSMDCIVHGVISMLR